MTNPVCEHMEFARDVEPSGDGCVECLAEGGRWVHLHLGALRDDLLRR